MNQKVARILAALGVLGVLVYFLLKPLPPVSNSPAPVAVTAENPSSNPVVPASPTGMAATSVPPVTAAPGVVTAPPAAGAVIPAPNPDASTIPPVVVLQNVRRAVRQYGDMFNGNPVGTNPEITAALSGKNPKQINFINGDAGMRVNEKGEMIDPWGTPYFFHQISGAEMEIHSAGPDRIMWTADDLVAR